jgi:D-aminoacyl-tRNA deacylase
MRIVVQRSKEAHVAVEGKTVGQIEHGLVLLIGIKEGDSFSEVEYLAEKIAHLRIFEDQTGRMNLDVLQTSGQILSISQFTLYGDVRKGRRPNYMLAATPEQAKPIYDKLNEQLRDCGLRVETGIFGAMMNVHLVNDGPVTILLDSERQF